MRLGKIFKTAMAATALAGAAAPGSTEQQAPAATQARSSTRLVLLGTAGGPVPRAQRSQPANLLQVGDRIYIIDTGEGVVRQLTAAGFQPKEVQSIFLTHLHMDHVAGLAPLMGMSWVARANRPMLVHGPTGTKALVEGALQYMAGPEALFAAQIPPGPTMPELIKAQEISGAGPVVIFQDDRVKVTAMRNSHYDTMDAAKLPKGAASYSYRFDTADRSVVFTGDSGPSDAIAQLAKGADILVSEVIDLPGTMNFMGRVYRVPPSALKPVADHMEKEHLVPEEIGRLAAKAGVGMVVLSHFVMGLDDETDLRAYSDGVRKYFKGPVALGRDLSEF